MASEKAGKRIDEAIGQSLKGLRRDRGHSAQALAELSGVSAAMASRIENGLVSPSISTLAALAEALSVPVVSLFREARTDHADFTLVRAGEGLKSARLTEGHRHDYVNPALRARKDLRFQARKVTLTRDGGKPPTYVGHGVVFVHVLAGRAVYRYGQQHLTLSESDSLSVDAELNHGLVDVLTPEFAFLTVQAERP